MTSAHAAVKGGMSIRKAAEMFSVPKSTLSDRVTGKIEMGSKWGKQGKLPIEIENEMINLAKKRADMGIGFSKKNFFRYAGVLADKRGVPFKHGGPSDMWWRRLKRRHEDFSLRVPKATATSRHSAMNRPRIDSYFKELKVTLERNNLDKFPSRIWNMDETGVTMSHKPPKVLAKKGSRTVHGKSSISRENITVIACGNASGKSLPPHFIIPGKTTKKLHGFDVESCSDENSPLNGAKFSVSDSGWTKDGIGRLWFTETFLPNIGDERPQLLIFDGHSSHNNVEFLSIARQQNIILGELPSHTSNWTQPFDRSVFKALKSKWNTRVDDFVKETGVSLTHSNFLRIFGKAWKESITSSNIIAGFRATGIYPFNPKAIPEEAFRPNESFDGPSNITQPEMLEDTSSTDQVLPSSNKDTDTLRDVDQNTVNTILLELPLNTEAGCYDLPISMGNISSPSLQEDDTVCTPHGSSSDESY